MNCLLVVWTTLTVIVHGTNEIRIPRTQTWAPVRDQQKKINVEKEHNQGSLNPCQDLHGSYKDLCQDCCHARNFKAILNIPLLTELSKRCQSCLSCVKIMSAKCCVKIIHMFIELS